MVNTTARLTEDVEWAAQDPLRRIVMLMGDFNVQAEEGVVDFAMLAGSRAAVAPGIRRVRWTPTWAMLTELSDKAASHYTTAAGVANRLDRVFVSIPPWALFGVVASAAVTENPVVMFRSGLPDHSPMEIALAARAMVPASIRPNTRGPTRDMDFPELLRRTLEVWHYLARDFTDKIALFPVAARSAARIVRDRHRGDWGGIGSVIVVAVARAVSMQRGGARPAFVFEQRPESSEWIYLEGQGLPQ